MYTFCGPHNIKHYTVFQAFAINFSPTKFAYMHEFINSLLWYGVMSRTRLVTDSNISYFDYYPQS